MELLGASPAFPAPLEGSTDSRKRVGVAIMSRLLSAASSKGHERVHVLFEAGGPVLVEVRFPGAVYSPDWHLCRTEDEYTHLIDQLEPDVILHVSRVWDLTNPTGAVCLRR
jgi:hypothetical protein